MAAPPPHWLPAFLRFCSVITITSKEKGRVPLVPYNAQTRFLREVAWGLERDIHHHVCLKARQLGISTLLLALDVFWLYMNPGLQGALVYDNATNTQQARRLITDMLEGLPEEWKVPVDVHNREALVLSNGSSLQYMSAGKGKNSGLGRSRAINYLHASEMSSWGDQDGIDSLRAALAMEHPDRLYLFESTALGYNVFYDMYQEAKMDETQHAFFIGWWAKETYQWPKDLPSFERWWGENPYLTDEEAATQAIVADQYGHQITAEQWAWHRWKSSIQGEASFKQEFPSHEDEAWQSTGFSFFNKVRLNADMSFLHQAGTKAGYQGFRYELGTKFTDLRIISVNEAKDVELRVWEQPRKGASYVIGVDVAYGRDEEADRSCVSVWRCFADKLVQVAEYATPEPETRQVAWVLAHLAGCYRGSMINLEITGPGAQVFAEMKYLKEQISFGQLRTDAQQHIHPDWALDNMRWFLYSRPDSLGPNYAFAWKTSLENKLNMMNRYRDSYSTEEVLIRSIPLLEEMGKFVQDGYSLHASGRGKDDRVMSAGLAHFAWAEWVRAPLMQAGETYQKVMARQHTEESRGAAVIDWLLPSYFAQHEADAQEAAERARRLTEY